LGIDDRCLHLAGDAQNPGLGEDAFGVDAVECRNRGRIEIRKGFVVRIPVLCDLRPFHARLKDRSGDDLEDLRERWVLDNFRNHDAGGGAVYGALRAASRANAVIIATPFGSARSSISKRLE